MATLGTVNSCSLSSLLVMLTEIAVCLSQDGFLLGMSRIPTKSRKCFQTLIEWTVLKKLFSWAFKQPKSVPLKFRSQSEGCYLQKEHTYSGFNSSTVNYLIVNFFFFFWDIVLMCLFCNSVTSQALLTKPQLPCSQIAKPKPLTLQPYSFHSVK